VICAAPRLALLTGRASCGGCDDVIQGDVVQGEVPDSRLHAWSMHRNDRLRVPWPPLHTDACGGWSWCGVWRDMSVRVLDWSMHRTVSAVPFQDMPGLCV